MPKPEAPSGKRPQALMKNNFGMHIAARLAFATSLTLLLVKFGAYYLTGSKAVLSDAIESIINVVDAFHFCQQQTGG